MVREAAWYSAQAPAPLGTRSDITASVDDEADYIAKNVNRFERDNPGFTWQVAKRSAPRSARRDVSVQLSR
jgi:hypothetical protein